MFVAIPLALIGLGVLLAATQTGCKKVEEVKERVLPPGCDEIRRPDSYEYVDEASYRVFYRLWLKEMGVSTPDPWLEKWLSNRNETSNRARFFLGAADIEFEPICEGKRFDPDRKALIEKWRAASTAFFKSYFSRERNSSDDGILVLLAGLAPVEAGNFMVMGAMNALNFPMDPPSHLRSQKTEFTQLLKAAYYFNVAADLADSDYRFSVERKRHTVKSRDAVTVRQNLKAMKDIMDSIKPEYLNDRQRPIYDTLKKAAGNFRTLM